jgi:uncharacterized DUF497 family protein
VAEQDFSEFTDKRVLLVENLDKPNAKGETAVELEGKVETGNAMGVLFKEKGKTAIRLIEANKIERITYAPETPKELKQKPLKLVTHGEARSHLIERHGYKVSDIQRMAEPEALSYHNTLDHADLGHRHEEKKPVEAKAAEQDAAAESAA